MSEADSAATPPGGGRWNWGRRVPILLSGLLTSGIAAALITLLITQSIDRDKDGKLQIQKADETITVFFETTLKERLTGDIELESLLREGAPIHDLNKAWDSQRTRIDEFRLHEHAALTAFRKRLGPDRDKAEIFAGRLTQSVEPSFRALERCLIAAMTARAAGEPPGGASGAPTAPVKAAVAAPSISVKSANQAPSTPSKGLVATTTAVATPKTSGTRCPTSGAAHPQLLGKLRSKTDLCVRTVSTEARWAIAPKSSEKRAAFWNALPIKLERGCGRPKSSPRVAP